MSDRKQLLWTLVLLNVLWAPVNFWVKLASNNGLSGAGLAAIRWSLLALLLGGLLCTARFRALLNAVWPEPKDRLQAVVLGLAFFGPAHLLYYLSMSMPNSSTIEGTVLLTTMPLWTGLFSVVILHEKMTKRRVIGLALAFVGAYVTAIGFRAPTFQLPNMTSNSTYLAGVIIETFGGVMATRLVRRSSGITVLWLQIAGAVPAVWLGPMIFSKQMPFVVQPQGAAWLTIAYLVFISGLVTFSVWYRLSERSPISLMAIGIALQPPISAILGYTIHHEPIGPNLAVGAMLVLLALAVAFSKGEKTTLDLHDAEVVAEGMP